MIAAIGVVGAGVYPLWDPDCRNRRAIPAAFILGTEDPTLGPLRRFEVEPTRSGPLWSEANGCRHERTLSLASGDKQATQVAVTRYSGCDDGANVVSYRVEGGGHTWPGGSQYLPALLVGPTIHSLDVTRTLWEFLSSHRR